MKSNITLSSVVGIAVVCLLTISGCKQKAENGKAVLEKPEYFLLHPEIEKAYCFTQAVRVGNIVKIMGVVSIDAKGMVIGKNFAEQMQNCYTDIDKVLKHYGCTFEDVVVENYFTTSMSELHQNAVTFRKKYYKKHYPTGTWIGVKELGSPDMMIEIEVEAIVPNI